MKSTYPHEIHGEEYHMQNWLELNMSSIMSLDKRKKYCCKKNSSSGGHTT